MSEKAKEMIFDEKARKKLLKGIETLADVTEVTLGPKGKNVAIAGYFGAGTITNDGNSIISEIELKDNFENMGAFLAKEAVGKMKDACGDGTTTTIILLRAIAFEAIKYVTAGINPINLKRGLEKALKEAIAFLEKNSKSIKTDEEILNLATVSASGNEEIGKIISESFKKVGIDGVITIEQAQGIETTVEEAEGVKFDRGYESAYFCTNLEKLIIEMQDPYILVTDKKISSIQDVLPILQQVASTNKELVIIADDFENEVLSTLVVNKLKGILKVAAVKAPAFGDRKKAIIEDLAISLNAKNISEDKGMALKDVKIEDLGSCNKIIITKDDTTIIGGKGKKEEIEERIRVIENEIALADNSYDKEKLEERKGKLSGGVVIIKVGAATEPELKQKKQVFEDSLSATRAGIEDGIVIGGGKAMLLCSKKLNDSKSNELNFEENLGYDILGKALKAPIYQIIQNSGFEPSVLIEKILEKDSLGFNAKTEKIEDLFNCGVIDPLKVIKHSLIYAVSTAGVVFMSEVLIDDQKNEENNN